MSASYRFVTRWNMPGSPALIYDTLSDVDVVAKFWPRLYAKVRVVKEGNEHGCGKVVEAQTKGPLPYVLNWRFAVQTCDYPNGYSIEADGDLIGHGEWTFVKNGDTTDVTYVWDVRGEKALLRWLSFVLRPLFTLNHEWVMRQGEVGLRKTLLEKLRNSA